MLQFAQGIHKHDLQAYVQEDAQTRETVYPGFPEWSTQAQDLDSGALSPVSVAFPDT